MLSDLAAAIRLQELDQRAGELTREIASLPKHIAEIEKKLDAHQRKLDADRAALSANQKERKKLEGDIQSQEQKISKLKDQTLQAKTNDQYRAFQHEIDFCDKEIRRFEDRILDLMTESEPLEKNVKTAEVALAAERAEVEKEKARARERTEADKKALAEIGSERGGIAGSMTAPVYANYERVRKSRGIAVAELVDGRCSVCHITVRPQYLQDMRKGEKVMSCESCSRILFYNPPVHVDTPDGAGTRVVMS